MYHSCVLLFRRMFRNPANNRSHLKDGDKGKIIGLKEVEVSNRRIANVLNLHPRTVDRWVNRFDETGSCKRKEGSGLTTKTTAEQDTNLALAAFENKFSTRYDLKHLAGVGHISDQAIGYRVKKLTEMNCRIAAQKEKLTDAHRAGRVQWAQMNVDLLQDEWDNVIWSDEKMFCSADHGPVRVWRERGTRMDKENIYEVSRSGRVSVSVWGCMSAEGLGPLVPIQGNLDRFQYTDILEQHMLPFAENRFVGDEHYTFMQDFARPHTAQHTHQWLEAHPEIQLFPWMPKGADLNPIENVWAMMERCVEELGAKDCKTRAELWSLVQSTWEQITNVRPDFTANLVFGMGDRCSAVIEKEGYWIDH